MTENPVKLFCMTHIGRQEPSFNGDIGDFRLNFVICGSSSDLCLGQSPTTSPRCCFSNFSSQFYLQFAITQVFILKGTKYCVPLNKKRGIKKVRKKFKSLKIRATNTRNCSFLFMRGVSTNADNHETWHTYTSFYS